MLFIFYFPLTISHKPRSVQLLPGRQVLRALEQIASILCYITYCPELIPVCTFCVTLTHTKNVPLLRKVTSNVFTIHGHFFVFLATFGGWKAAKREQQKLCSQGSSCALPLSSRAGMWAKAYSRQQESTLAVVSGGLALRGEVEPGWDRRQWYINAF